MKIAFIGLGAMGGPMSLCLARAGHEIAAHDIDRDGPGARAILEAGARWAGSPKEAAQGSEIVFTSLPGPVEVEAVALGENGIFAGAAKGSVFIDLSTNAPSMMRKIYRAGLEKGIHVLDSPVSEGADRAKHEGTLTLMVGGDREVFDRVAPVLQAIGRDRLFYVGESGSGAVCKLVNNLQVYVIQSSLAEALTLGRLAGVSVERLVEVIGRSTGQSRVADDFQESLAQRDAYDGTAGFPLWIGRKDTRLATDFGRELDYPMPLANEVDALFTEWMSRGWHNKGIEVQMMIDEALARLGKTE